MFIPRPHAMITHTIKLQAFTEYNIHSWEKQAPAGMHAALTQYASMINAPSIGSHRHYMWYSFQMNLACPQHESNRTR